MHALNPTGIRGDFGSGGAKMDTVQAKLSRRTSFTDLFFSPGEWLLSRFLRIDRTGSPLFVGCRSIPRPNDPRDANPCFKP
jgi:hypothetical protein